MDNPAAEWEASCDLFQQFVTKLQRSRAVNVNSSKIKDLLRNAVQAYFRAARPALLTLGLSEQDLEEIDSPLQELLRLAGGNNSARSYRRWIRAARRAIVETTGKVEKRLGHVPMQTAGRNSTEDLIIETLRAMIPSAAASYQQALVDLNDVSRASFR